MAWETFCADYEQLAQWNAHLAADDLARSTQRLYRTVYIISGSTLLKPDAVEELVQSHEDRPQSHLSTRQISRELGISRRTVSRIVHDDQLLTCLKRRRAHKLTSANQRIVRGTRLSYCVAANQTPLLQTCGHQTHGPQPD